MRSKLLAARKAISLGVSVFVGTGQGKEKLADILEGKGDGTYIGGPFHSQMQMKKQWIAYHSQVGGIIEVDNGAEKAIVQNGKSLLPVGVRCYWGLHCLRCRGSARAKWANPWKGTNLLFC